MKRISQPLFALCTSVATALSTAVIVAFAFAGRGAAQAETWAPTVVAAPASAFSSDTADYAIARAASASKARLPLLRPNPPSLDPVAAQPLDRTPLPTPASAIASEIVPAIQPDVGGESAVPAAPAVLLSVAHLPVLTTFELSGAPHAAPARPKALRRGPTPSDDSLFDAPMEVRWSPAVSPTPGLAASAAGASIAVNP